MNDSSDLSSDQFKKATLDLLIQKSYDAATRAHVPYSNFPVGASLLCKDGSIYTGCNVENAAYSLSTCAERTAIVKAVSEGKKDLFETLVVCALRHNDYISPCGSCRQIMSEFGDYDVYLCKTKSDYKHFKVSELLPFSFKF